MTADSQIKNICHKWVPRGPMTCYNKETRQKKIKPISFSSFFSSEIGHWMRRDRAPRNRLSLRSFSILLCGAIRLYRDEVNKLLSGKFTFFKEKYVTYFFKLYKRTRRQICSQT